MVKYFNPIKHHDAVDIAADIVKEFNLDISPVAFNKLIERRFDEHFDNLDLFLEKPLPFDVILDLAIHDLSGSLRGNTSAGLGFEKDRKTLARLYRDDFKTLYDHDVFDLEIYWKIFLKDELRLKDKKTRSIAVGQLHLWFLTMKYLGGLYFYMKEINPEWSAFGMNDTVRAWSEKLQSWSRTEKTYGYDIRNQDSKMSPGFAKFFETFLKRHSPASHWDGIEWYFREAFFNKKIVDNKGYILSFSQGEVSGDPLTLIKNICHNLFIHVVHEAILEVRNEIDHKKKLLLGDDTLMQTLFAQLFREVAIVIGHDTTAEQGSFLNEIEFLSMKLTQTEWGIAPYYSNLDKMYASLLYTTHGTDEYFQKLCSFMNLLVFAPENTTESIWFDRINEHALFMLKSGAVSRDAIKSYKTKYMLIQSRLGWGED